MVDVVTFTGPRYGECGPHIGKPIGNMQECYPFELPARGAYGDLPQADRTITDPGPRSWSGSLLEGSRDVSGFLYRRNRYLDPRNGAFTQEDPIGLAGGLNLYGFAEGDPINFWDPFGLNPCESTRNRPAGQSEAECKELLRAGSEMLRPLEPRNVVRAVRAFWRNYRDMRRANVVGGDKYFHCMANCEASQQGPVGRATARVVSDLREATDVVLKGDPADSAAADQRANRDGRRGGAENPDQPCRRICQTHRPRGLNDRY